VGDGARLSGHARESLSAADWQLHQTDADLLYDAATMDTDANGCMEQLW
jgi:hypothetical protein